MAPLELPVAAVDLAWPSVKEAEKGWDFCNQDSDEDDGSWVEEMDLKLALEPEIASGPEDDSAAWLVNSGPAQHSEDVVPKRTFAEAVLSFTDGTGAPAVPAGYRMPTQTAITKQELKQLRSITGSLDDEAVAGDDFNARVPGHGWKKQHKASRSGRQQRKLEQQTQKRAEQSFRTRGWLDEKEQDDA